MSREAAEQGDIPEQRERPEKRQRLHPRWEPKRKETGTTDAA